MPPEPYTPDARREALALALAGGKSVAAAARKLGIGVSTAFLWKAEPGFAGRVAALRAELFAEAVGVLAGANARAARRLARLVGSKEARVALAAAVKTLELGRMLHEAGELLARVEQLEARDRDRQKGKQWA
jgi:transposase-like protein